MINPHRFSSYGDPETISQLDWCIRHFKEKGKGNNHCFITVGDPMVNFNYDAAYDNENERRTSPCLRGLDIKIKDDKVILGIIYRSWDLFAGFPENVGGFALLNQYIANQLEIEPGPLTFSSQGLHIYSHQIETVKAYLRS
jgi:thymidylate synthase